MSEDFKSLSHTLQIQVDEAFDAALKSNQSIGLSPIWRRKSSAVANSELAGGFDISDDPPGGFLLSKANNIQPSDDDLIPLSLIRSALQFLDLPPDDEEVLQVFHNAAGGWSGAPRPDGEFIASDEETRWTVTRKDWRAVCSIIIGVHKGEDVVGEPLIDEEQTAGVQGGLLQEEDTEDERNDDDDGDDDDDDDEDEAYQESLSSLSSDQVSESDSDEYTGDPSSSKARSKSSDRKSKHTSTSISNGMPTPRQKRASLDAFELFFPSSLRLTDDDLTTKRLTFKDIVKVAAILKENIKAEDVEEMLSLFSTSPDKSISFDDFTRMMIIAKLAWYASIISSLHIQAHYSQMVTYIAQVLMECVLIDTNFRKR